MVELISRIKADHKIQKLEEPLSINYAGVSIASVSPQFVFFQVLIDCLLRLQSTPADKKELIDSCEKYYKANHTRMSNIRDLHRLIHQTRLYGGTRKNRCFTRFSMELCEIKIFT